MFLMTFTSSFSSLYFVIYLFRLIFLGLLKWVTSHQILDHDKIKTLSSSDLYDFYLHRVFYLITSTTQNILNSSKPKIFTIMLPVKKIEYQWDIWSYFIDFVLMLPKSLLVQKIFKDHTFTIRNSHLWFFFLNEVLLYDLRQLYASHVGN